MIPRADICTDRRTSGTAPHLSLPSIHQIYPGIHYHATEHHKRCESALVECKVRQTYSLKIKRNIDLCCSAAEAFSLLGNNVKAHAYIDSAYAAINTKHDRMIALEADYTILDREHNVSKAYPVLKHIHEISDSITTKALLQSVTVAHDKYLQEKKELADYKIKTNRVIYSLLLVLAATLILLSIKIIRSEKKAHSKTKEVLVNTE